MEADFFAMVIVVLASVAGGLGSLGKGGVSGLIWGTAIAMISWYVWAYITYIVGTKILPEPQTRANYGELLRTIGFSSSPGLIRILGFERLPSVGVHVSGQLIRIPQYRLIFQS
jgi:hypothetical protein